MLVRALWPRRGDGPPWLARALLAIVLSVSITILVGIALGFAPHGEGRGWLQTSGTGAPIAEAVLVAVSAALFAVGWRRGAWTRAAQ